MAAWTELKWWLREHPDTCLVVYCAGSRGGGEGCRFLAVVVPDGDGVRLDRAFTYAKSGPDPWGREAWAMGKPVADPSLDVAGAVRIGCPDHGHVDVDRGDLRREALRGQAAMARRAVKGLKARPAELRVKPTGD